MNSLQNLFTNLPDEITFLNSDNSERKEPLRSTFNNSKLQENANGDKTCKKRTSNKVILKRKFPGPAGLFPETNAAVNPEDTAEHQNSFLLGSVSFSHLILI